MTTDLDLLTLLDALYERLDDVRRALAVRVSNDDEFELGINCRLTNEEWWLLDVLDKMEKTR
jgi:hypothetical protein